MKIIQCAIICITAAVFHVQADSPGYREWMERRDALKQDAGVVRYYTFENMEDSESVVKDLSGNEAHLVFVPFRDRATGEVFDDMEVVEGRWPGKTAVRLDRGWYQGATYNIENRQFTAEVWFRRQGPGSIMPASNLRNGHILSVSGARMGWRLCLSYDFRGRDRSGMVFFMGRERGYEGEHSAGTDIGIPDYIWHHAAITWNGEKMRLYLNGEMIAESVFEQEYIQVEAPDLFKIGYAALGWGSVVLDIDEVVIYDRQLNPDEIKESFFGYGLASEKDVFASADSFLKAGDYQSARVEYEKLKRMPDFGRELALFNIAESYRLEGEYASAHKTLEKIFDLPGLTTAYLVYGMFRQADLHKEMGDYGSARAIYGKIAGMDEASVHHVFKAQLATGETYGREKNFSSARNIYKNMLRQEETSDFPNDGYRLRIRERLEEIEGLADGAEVKCKRQKRLEWISSPDIALYVSLSGSDSNPGTKENPFATIKRARQEVRKIRAEQGNSGITVYIRGGDYFIDEGISFGREDSGSDVSPVVYRNFPGEDVRIIGGREITALFSPLQDPEVLERLPEESRERVWVADLKEAGITEYGELLTRGMGRGYRQRPRPGAEELIFNGRIMELSRWPNEGWARIEALTQVEGIRRTTEVQFGKFIYSGDRPLRWIEEKDMWLQYRPDLGPYVVLHAKISDLDTEKRTITLRPDPLPDACPSRGNFPLAENDPYFVYNLLSEVERPGEWHLDRETGRLYFYPPQDIRESEVIVTTLDEPVFSFNDASNIVLAGLLIDGTWRNGIEIEGGRNNLIAGCTIRNTGQYAVIIGSGWEHKVVGCDIYDTGEGGVLLEGGDREKLIPANHTVENNHIYRFNRFCGGYRPAVWIDGIGQRVAHNVIHDSPHQAIYFNANDHIIEFNEIHDAPYLSREMGTLYIYGEPWYLMSRGTVIRNNFFHHVTFHASPHFTHGLNVIHIDAMNAGLVIENNIFYRFPRGISSNYPGNIFTNNIFVEGENIAISQGDRSNIFCEGRDIDAGPNLRMMHRLAMRLESVNHKQPPWSFRYPPLVDMMEKEPAKWGGIQGSIIERNVNTGGPFVSFARGVRAGTVFENNWDGQNPFFADTDGERKDFRLRPGSPIYGHTGFEPLPPTEQIGVYEDKLRASWPLNRTPEDIGRYYMPDREPSKQALATTLSPVRRVSEPLEYVIRKRHSPIDIDGKPEENEYLGLDKEKAIVVERHHLTGESAGFSKSFLWFLYDDENLYIAAIHEPDPWKEDMPERLKEHIPLLELSFESQEGAHSQAWWPLDMQTGPIYVISANYKGELSINNIFGMPNESVRALQEEIEYKVYIVDDEKRAWTSEIKIPLDSIGIEPSEVEQLAFNAGKSTKAGWLAWVPTGTSVWRVDNAGFIKFER